MENTSGTLYGGEALSFKWKKGKGRSVRCYHTLKYNDCHHDNAFFARVGGVSNAEMNKLELELLGVLDFEVMLSRRLYDLYRAHLHKQQADDHHDTPNKPDQEPSRVDGGEEDHDDDRITRLPEGVLRYDWSQQAPAANGGRRHSSSQAPSRYS
uniref:Uncharacterized protein n=1 Tax=Aegilops tauschii TaxID=37682 RepID=M8D1S9_AEGTA